jgi:hypothetical protein
MVGSNPSNDVTIWRAWDGEHWHYGIIASLAADPDYQNNSRSYKNLVAYEVCKFVEKGLIKIEWCGLMEPAK